MKLDKVIAVRNNKTVYRDGDLRIKIFMEDFSKADILNEALNHARVEETVPNVPKLREVTRIDGKWAIIFEYVKGKTLEQLMYECPEKKEEYIKLLVKLQTDVHKRECSQLVGMKEKLILQTKKSGLPEKKCSELMEKIENMPDATHLCHGDFSPENIIISQEGEAYIIDWAHTVRGNCAVDAAKTYISLKMGENSDIAEEYIEIFGKESNVSVEEIKSYIPVAAVAKMSRSRVEERKILMSMINM